ncbi:tetratricopeptide repeat protein [Lacinutrix himadriensis]|uniref:tetratricopeptide repeat-containing sensor histidine kinase n=1 Tax=Lacinutrix himadriensis TaxID=641549 RepID=UPI000AD7BF4F|nr:tetratricopeptide repeat protein [Lacinutrix himadriensis]
MKIINILIVFLIISLFFPVSVIAQNKYMDSLHVELQKHKERDTTRADILYDLAFTYFQRDMKLTNLYIDEAEAINDSLNFTRGKANIFYIKGIIESRKSNYAAGLDYYKQSLKLFDSLNDEKGMASLYNAIGVSHYQQSQYDEALNYYNKALLIYEAMHAKKKLVASLLNIGTIYAETGQYPEAISNYKKGLTYSREINHEYGIPYALSNLGIVYKYLGNFPLAIEHYKQAFAYLEKEGDTIGMSNALNSLGTVYRSMGKYDKALAYHNQSIDFQSNNGSKSLIATNKANIGLIYKSKKEYTKALQFINESLLISQDINAVKQTSICLKNIAEVHLLLKKPAIARENYIKSMDISKEIGDQQGLAETYLGIAATYLEEKQYKKALSYTLKGEEIANNLKVLPSQKKASELLFQIYEHQGDYKKALINHQKFKAFQDSLFNKENIEKITQLEYEYKYKQQLDSSRIRELQLTKVVTATSKDLQKSKQDYLWAIIGFLLISILLGGIIFYQKLKNIKSKTQNIVIEQKLLRSQMTPHFIFNSLSVLQGMILNKEEKKSVYYLSKFSKLLRIILENSRDKTVSLSQELTAIQNYLALQNLENDDYQSTVLVEDSIDIPLFEVPPMLIQPFVENAIEHAFVDQKENRKIDIRLSYLEKKLICTIIDNGVGVASKKEGKNTHKKSLSTLITSERLEVLSKDFNMQGSVSIEDRKKYNEQGTIVTLIIPYKTVA